MIPLETKINTIYTIATIGKETAPLPVDPGYLHEWQNAIFELTGEKLIIRN